MLLILAAFCGGCATVSKTGSLTSCSISGTPYVSLISLCDLNHITWDYDLITRTFDLTRQPNKIKLQVGSNTAFVNGSPRTLSGPVQVHRGMVVVPDQFRQQIVEPMFRQYSKPAETITFYSVKKVIIDPGHGGKDPGAIGKHGLYEKYVTLDIARRLAALLRQHGVEVMMTRTSDRFVRLEDRAQMTERSNADLFISIHANANRSRSLNGFEVYYVAPKVSDAERAHTAAKNLSLAEYKDSMAGVDPVLKAILWDMVYTYNKSESIQLSKKICSAIGRSVDCRVIGTKGANFCVLRGSCIPAILVEVGFLSNAKEEQLLNVGSYRQKIAEGIQQGIREYAYSMAHREPQDQHEIAAARPGKELE